MDPLQAPLRDPVRPVFLTPAGRPNRPTIAGFICGVVGFGLTITYVGALLGGPAALVGVLLSSVGLARSDERRGLAVAGVIVSAVGVILAVLYIAAMVLARSHASHPARSLPSPWSSEAA